MRGWNPTRQLRFWVVKCFETLGKPLAEIRRKVFKLSPDGCSLKHVKGFAQARGADFMAVISSLSARILRPLVLWLAVALVSSTAFAQGHGQRNPMKGPG